MTRARALLHERMPRLARIALLFVVLCGLGAQQWAQQSHWHVPSAAGPVAVPAEDSGDARHHDCVWCQVAAHAGAVAPPESRFGVVDVEALQFAAPSALRQVLFKTPPAHSWQSRGPPQA